MGHPFRRRSAKGRGMRSSCPYSQAIIVIIDLYSGGLNGGFGIGLRITGRAEAFLRES